MRGIDGTTYVDSYPSIDTRTHVVPAGHTVETSVGVGPFTVFISADLLEPGGDLVYPFMGEIVLAEPLDACSPLTNGAAIAGKIALVIRGNCAFTLKGQNAADAGALTTIIYNSNPDLTTFGGSEIVGGGPTFAMNGEDGPVLNAAVQAGTVMATINPPTSIYAPALGTPGGKVDMIHPGGDQSIVQVVLSDAPADAFALEDPDFEAAGIIPGDKIVFICPDGDAIRFDTPLPILFSHEEAVVDTVSGNTITLTTPLVNDCSLPDSSMTFVPRVRVLGSLEGGLPGPLLSVSGGAAVTVRGIYFSQPKDRPFRSGTNMASVFHSGVELPNCVFYDRTEAFQEVTFYQSRLGGNVGDAEGRDDVAITGFTDAPLAIINNGFQANNAHVSLGSLSVLGSRLTVSYTHLRAHETREDLVCRLLLEKKK